MQFFSTQEISGFHHLSAKVSFIHFILSLSFFSLLLYLPLYYGLPHTRLKGKKR